MGLGKKYVYLLKKYPASTKIITGATLVGFTDVVAQYAIERTDHWDHKRSLRLGGIALFVITPLTRTWVDLVLPRFFPITAKTTTSVALKKVLADMVFFGPPISTMLVGMNMMFSGEVAMD